MNKQKIIFLDRDGTINVDHGYVHRVEDWDWVHGAIEAIKKFSEAGYLLAIVTNQSGIGHGLYTEQDMVKVHRCMVEKLKSEGVQLAAVMHCPHRRDGGCGCRKPEKGMIDEVIKIVGPVDFSDSWVIGDKEADVGLGKNAGTKTALIRGRFWQEDKLEVKPDLVVDSLAEAAEKILS